MRALFALLVLFSTDAGAAVRGSILTPDGSPIPAATVRLYPLENDAERMARLRGEVIEQKPVAEVVSDAKGNFSVAAPEGSDVLRMQITKEGYAPAGAFVTPEFDVAGIVLDPAAAVTGTVRDRGRPAGGATVRISDNDAAEWVARTDEKGNYSVPAPDKWARLITVLLSDGRSWTETAFNPGELSADRTLRRSENITGTLFHSDGKTPAGGARILLNGSEVGETAGDGTFRVDDPPHGWERVEFIAENGWATRSSTARPNLGSVRLGQSATVAGTIRAGREGIAGVRVGLSPDTGGPAFFGVPQYEAVTDSRGKFTIDRVAPGRYRIQSKHPLYEIRDSVVEVTSGARADESIAAAPRTMVTGHIVDEDGHAIAGASLLPKTTGRGQMRMAMLPRSVRTWSAADGRFVARFVPPDEPTALEARKRGLPPGTSDTVRVSVEQPVAGLRITIPQGHPVSGRVTDEHENPIAGTTITASEVRSEGNRMVVYGGQRNDDDGVVTDAEGRFVIRLTEGRWNVTAGGDHWSYSTRNVVEVSGPTENIDFVLQPAVTLRGRVVRKGSGGIANARVAVMAQGTGPRSATTAHDGSFEVTGLTPGSSMVMVDKPEEMLREMRMTTIPQDDLLIEIPPGATLTGRVVDAESDSPIPSFAIGVSGDRSGAGIVIQTLPVVQNFENETGEFVLEHVTSDPAELIVRAPGYVEKRVRGIEAPAGETREGLLVELERGTTVTGRVTDESGSALSGVRISRVEQSRMMGPPPVGGGTATDAEGRYEAGPFDGESVTLRFERDGYRDEVLDVKLDRERVTADARLSRGATIAGQVVTESGAPVAGAAVSVSAGGPFDRNSTTSDSSGMFKLEGVGEATAQVTAEKSGYVPATEDVNPSAGRTLRLVLGEGGTVAGRVRGLSPGELADTSVQVRSGATVRSARVDQSGAFRVDGVKAGTASVSATSRGFGPGRTSPVSTVEVARGGETWVDIDMSGGYQISGEVMINGEPASDVMVTFIPADPVVQTRSSATSDALGRYSANGLQAGAYRVSAVRFGTSSMSWQGEYVVERDDRFDINIQGVTIEGRVIDASTGRGVEGAALEIRAAEQGGVTFVMPGRGPESGVDGSFTFRNITPGRWTIRATAQGLGSTAETIDVGTSGARVELRLSPSEGAVLRIVDAATAAPIQAFVTARDASGTVVYNQMVRPGGDGTTRLPLGTGNYQITIFSPGYARKTITVRSPSSGLTVPLSRGGTLNVNVGGSETLRARIIEAASGEPVSGGSGGLLALTPGTNVIQNVPSGTARIDIIDESGVVERSVTVSVTEGGIASVNL